MIPYKDDNPTERPAIVTILLIVINTAAFIYFRLQPGITYERAIFEFGMIPYEFWHQVNLPFSAYLDHLRQMGAQIGPGANSLSFHPISPYLTLLTSMFMHGGVMHLAGNMLFLWIFGNNVEDYLGHIKYLLIYLFWGLAAAGAHLITNPASTIPTVGASGAISGVLGAYLVLFPFARIYVLVPLFFFFFTTTLPAWAMLIFWFVFQIVSTIPAGAAEAGGVAYAAHIGGFLSGVVLMLFFKKKPRRRGAAFRARSYRGFSR